MTCDSIQLLQMLVLLTYSDVICGGFYLTQQNPLIGGRIQQKLCKVIDAPPWACISIHFMIDV